MTDANTEGAGKTAAELRDMQVRVIAGLRRGASNEKLTIDHLRKLSIAWQRASGAFVDLQRARS